MSVPTTTGPVVARVGDRERRRCEDLLAQAHALGYLDQPELEARLDQVLASTTVDDLARTTVDLPVHRLHRADPRRRERRARAARRGVAVHAAAVAVVGLLVLVIWLAVAVPTGAWYPWPVWPILGGAAGLAWHGGAVRLCCGPRRP